MAITHNIPPTGWWERTEKAMQQKSLSELQAIVKDCIETAELQWEFNPKASMYRDEGLMAANEIHRRVKKATRS